MVEFKLMELDKLIDLDKSDITTRRNLLKFGAVCAGAGVLGTIAVAGPVGYLIGRPSPSSRPQETAIPVTPAAEKSAEPIVSIQPFVDPEANEIARQKEIGPDSFFVFSNKTLDGLSAFLGDTLYPIYPLSVLDLEQRKLIYTLTKEFQVPPNVIASIMTIESAGLGNEESWVGAQGLFQVMPFHFDASIRNNPAAMQEPLLNGRTGMKFFVETCLKAARAGFPPGYPQNHVNVYARALMAYNAGADAGRVNFDRVPDETKFYRDHFIRLAMTADLAEGLRKKGNGDLDIVKKLSSVEMDARAWALSKFAERKGGIFSYEEYQEALKEISLETPGVDKKTKLFTDKGEEFYRDYQDYINNPKYIVPVSPGLRIWLNLGGIRLFLKDPRNINLEEWNKIQSR